MWRTPVIPLPSGIFGVYRITKGFMKKQILGLLWSVFVMASVVFAMLLVFGFLHVIEEIFLINEW